MFISSSTFPNLSVLASYQALSQVMIFEDMTRKEFNLAINDPLNPTNIEKTALIAHETSHFIDHIATLHGQKMLLEIYNAFNAITSQNEYLYHHVITLKNTLRRTKFEDYYKNYNINRITTDKNEYKWSFRNTIGLRYDSCGKPDIRYPIIFSSFFYNNQFLARIPLSVEALWEANAVAAEIQLSVASIFKNESKDERVVSLKILQNKYKDWIYTPELLTYSTAAHLVSARLKYNDLLSAFIITKAISSICLNMPDVYYSNIKIPSSMNLPKERLSALLSSNDPAILFYLMVINIQESGENIYNDERMIVDVNKILHINNLPNKSKIKEQALKEIKNYQSQSISGLFQEAYSHMSTNGLRILELIGISSTNASYGYTQVAKDSLNICGVEEFLDEDNQIFQRIDDISYYEKQLELFIKACGY